MSKLAHHNKTENKQLKLEFNAASSKNDEIRGKRESTIINLHEYARKKLIAQALRNTKSF